MKIFGLNGETHSVAATALLDTGSSVSLISQDLLTENEILYTPTPIASKITSFTGGKVIASTSGEFKLDFGAGRSELVDLVIFQGKGSYPIILGFDLFNKLVMELVVSPYPYLKIQGQRFCV